MIDLSSVVASPEFAQVFQIKRESVSIAAEGRAIAGAPVILTAFGTVTPAKAADMLLLLPEGERVQNGLRIFTRSDLRPGDGVGALPDLVVWNGNEYRVLSSRPWGAFGYVEAFAVQVVPHA